MSFAQNWAALTAFPLEIFLSACRRVPSALQHVRGGLFFTCAQPIFHDVPHFLRLTLDLPTLARSLFKNFHTGHGCYWPGGWHACDWTHSLGIAPLFP